MSLATFSNIDSLCCREHLVQGSLTDVHFVCKKIPFRVTLSAGENSPAGSLPPASALRLRVFFSQNDAEVPTLAAPPLSYDVESADAQSITYLVKLTVLTSQLSGSLFKLRAEMKGEQGGGTEQVSGEKKTSDVWNVLSDFSPLLSTVSKPYLAFRAATANRVIYSSPATAPESKESSMLTPASATISHEEEEEEEEESEKKTGKKSQRKKRERSPTSSLDSESERKLRRSSRPKKKVVLSMYDDANANANDDFDQLVDDAEQTAPRASAPAHAPPHLSQKSNHVAILQAISDLASQQRSLAAEQEEQKRLLAQLMNGKAGEEEEEGDEEEPATTAAIKSQLAGAFRLLKNIPIEQRSELIESALVQESVQLKVDHIWSDAPGHTSVPSSLASFSPDSSPTFLHQDMTDNNSFSSPFHDPDNDGLPTHDWTVANFW